MRARSLTSLRALRSRQAVSLHRRLARGDAKAAEEVDAQLRFAVARHPPKGVSTGCGSTVLSGGKDGRRPGKAPGRSAPAGRGPSAGSRRGQAGPTIVWTARPRSAHGSRLTRGSARRGQQRRFAPRDARRAPGSPRSPSVGSLVWMPIRTFTSPRSGQSCSAGHADSPTAAATACLARQTRRRRHRPACRSHDRRAPSNAARSSRWCCESSPRNDRATRITSRVEPSMSLNSSVTVPRGNSACGLMRRSLAPGCRSGALDLREALIA